MFGKSREKRIKELHELLFVINALMEGMSRRRGEYIIELSHLEAEQIEAEAALDVLTVGP